MNLKEFIECFWNLGKMGTTISRPDGGSIVLLANGAVHSIEPLNRALSHVKQSVTLGDADSFNDYFNRFKNGNSIILADVSQHPPKFAGVIDYHEAPPEAGGTAEPRYGDHRLGFAPVYSEQYARWREIDGEMKSQVDFLEFLEENYLDVMAPDSARLLEQVMDLEAKTDVTFKSAVRLSDGSTSLTYNEEVKTGSGTVNSQASFPTMMRIAVPMFVGDRDPVTLDCLLRFRIQSGKLSFMVKIKRRDLVERERVEGMVTEIATITNADVLLGRLG